MKIAKGSVAISFFVMLIFFVSSFAHRISQIGRIIESAGKKIFKKVFDLKKEHAGKYHIAIKFFPMDMKKIEVTHLNHMKQRE